MMRINVRGLLALAVTWVGMQTHSAQAEHWAVIVAGSKGYWNYRHQADACHAYHVVRRHGIPEENVILMMYDDVANATENPFPGLLYNMPANASTGEGPMEVYTGCNVDYRGEDVTPDNFLSVLLGDSAATKGKKVLASGPNDRVFVNFVDHGAAGVIVFPDDQLLTSTQLVGTMEKMHQEKKYKELVFYVEACESGSMFQDVDLSKINAFVTTAANATESSYGFFCPPMDTVHGESMNTCLGDLYSINWMKDSDRTDLSGETLRNQFKIVQAQTNLSHVESFGGKHIRHEIVGNFQSNYDMEPSSSSGSTDSDDSNDANDAVVLNDGQANRQEAPLAGAVNAHDVNVVLAFYKYLRSDRGPARATLAEQLIGEIQRRERADRLFARIQEQHLLQKAIQVTNAGVPTAKAKLACRDGMFKAFKDECGHADEENGIGHGFSSYSLQYAQNLGKICETTGDVAQLRTVLRQSCQPHVKTSVAQDDSVMALA